MSISINSTLLKKELTLDAWKAMTAVVPTPTSLFDALKLVNPTEYVEIPDCGVLN